MAPQLPQNPFPGMNPYLENSGLWPDAHNSLIIGLRTFLTRQLRPEYRVSTQERVYVLTEPEGNGNSGVSIRVADAAVLTLPDGSGRPIRRPEPERSKDAIAVQLPATELFKERYLEVRRTDNRRLVAIIELLSPTNKGGDGRKEYLAKRADVLYSPTHLVEIDLLRAGQPMPVVGDVPASHYRILVANARRTEPIADLYPFKICQPIPVFVLPLEQDAEGVAVDLNAVVNDVYADGAFDLAIDYRQDPEPPLADDDRAWLDQLLRAKGLRNDAV